MLSCSVASCASAIRGMHAVCLALQRRLANRRHRGLLACANTVPYNNEAGHSEASPMFVIHAHGREGYPSTVLPFTTLAKPVMLHSISHVGSMNGLLKTSQASNANTSEKKRLMPDSHAKHIQWHPSAHHRQCLSQYELPLQAADSKKGIIKEMQKKKLSGCSPV
ncbi:hypothetical protein GGI42DRAFT_256391 [Trichoderma sp. SZMC 28013]